MSNLELSANLSGMNYNSSFQDAKITEAYSLGIGVEAPGGDALESLASARPDLNGVRVRQAGGTMMFLIDRGLKRHVPDPQTFNNLFKDWSHYDVLDIDSIETGAPLPSGAILASPIGDGTVYLLDSGCKRHVTGPSVMKKYNFNWDRVYKLPPLSLANIPLGDAIY
jgi:hypothetical protein